MVSGEVQMESVFDLEYVTKVPITSAHTEWKIRQEKRQGRVALKKEGSMFGFEESILALVKQLTLAPSAAAFLGSSQSMSFKVPNR